MEKNNEKTTNLEKETQTNSNKKTTEKNSKNKNKKTKLEQEIENLKKQLEEKNTDYLRLLADFENFRKRKEKETAELRDRILIDFILQLLPIIDNFEMSLKMTDNKEMFIKGVEMIHKNLIDILKQHHFEEFHPSIGEEFDPIKHDPLPIEDETKKPGEIVNILKKGFKHKENIIRPAKVQIVKETSKSEENQNNNSNNNNQQNKN